MNEAVNVERLSKTVELVSKAAKFCVSGCLDKIDPGIEIEGLGALQLPMKPKVAKALVAACQVAPYGKGTQTLVNKEVRNTYELNPEQFRISDGWEAAIAELTRSVAEQLGLPADELDARIYKLLVYEKGGFFLAHRDSEKHDRMVASLIVVLPNPFEGGCLDVRHADAQQSLPFAEAGRGEQPCYAAFYADCEHEVLRVTSGVRVCLAYNLVLKPRHKKRVAAAIPADSAASSVLAKSISAWTAKQPVKPLVFALEHHYTERGLSLDLLKGTDRQLADLVVSAAASRDCFVHLAQVTRHLCQFADDGSAGDDDYGYDSYSRRRRSRRHAIEIGETYEDELQGSEWADASGQKQPWGAIALDQSAIVSQEPMADWIPTKEEFEGYTGNAGNTLDRWYHRSAIVVWKRSKHFDVVASSGAVGCIPLWFAMTSKLDKTPKMWLEEARSDAIRFARAIVSKWPTRIARSQTFEPRDNETFESFSTALLTLHDRDTIGLFLSTVAVKDQTLPLSSCVVSACREFGWSAFAQELKLLLTSRPYKYSRDEIPPRDIEWLSAFCRDETEDSDKSQLADELRALAVERFCVPQPPIPTHYSPGVRRQRTDAEMSLPSLLKAMATSGRDDHLSRVIQFVRNAGDDFDRSGCQVPCLNELVPWSQREFGLVRAPLASWLTSVREQLESATAEPPQPPTNWSRPADVPCTCRLCAQLKSFLADPTIEVARIRASEDDRSHLITAMHRHQSDAKHDLDRTGRPFTLVLTKTSGSYARAAKQFESNVELLSSLPADSSRR